MRPPAGQRERADHHAGQAQRPQRDLAKFVPISTAERAIGIDLNRSMMPRVMSVFVRVAACTAVSAMVCMKKTYANSTIMMTLMAELAGYPLMSEALRTMGDPQSDTSFEAGLALIIDGIRRRVTPTR